MNVQDDLTFFAPELLIEELKKYSGKIQTYSKLNKIELFEIETLVLSNINLVSEEMISEQTWKKAFDLTRDIDEDDTPFIALALELGSKLWTGDKILSKGLNVKGINLTVTTTDLKKIIRS